MSPEGAGAVDRLMRAGARDGVFPGAVLLAGREGRIRFHEAYGIADCRDGTPVVRETRFDLASLTKPLAAAMAVLLLWQSGRLHPGDALGRLLPEAAATDKASIRVDQLLAHTSGLPAHHPFYRVLRRLPLHRRKPVLRRWLLRMPLESPPGAETRYSDLGYMLLEWVIERIAGRELDGWVADGLYRPLGLHSLGFPGDRLREGGDDAIRFAATERCGRRGGVLSGVVHDDNARVCGGVAGHAGLFGTAFDVFRLLSRLSAAYGGAEGGGLLDPGRVRFLLTPVGPGRRTPGFDVPSGPAPSCGRRFSPETVGHLGFTGASFWMDLAADATVVLLANRVHPSRWNLRIRKFRPILHDLVREFLAG
jgi:serine-type D-Ala-D-Ala carboxypeptidase